MPTSDARLALVLLAAVSPSLASGAAGSQRGSQSPARTPDAVIREVLLGSAKDSSRPVEAWVEKLKEAGRSLVPGLVEVLASGELPMDAEGRTIDERQEEIVLGALERFPRGNLDGRIESLLDRRARSNARRDGYRLLGAIGTRQDLLFLCGALCGPVLDADPDREEAACFRAAVARILGRDELGFPLVRTLLHDRPAPVRYYLIGALSDTGSAAALEILGAELRSRPEENVWLLSECSRLAAAVELPVDGAIASSIRVHLRSDDAMEVRAAAECLGKVEDKDSVPDLTNLLVHPHPDVQRAALEALRAITGASLLADPERWRAWLRSESEWFSGSAERLSDDLAGSDPLRRMAAIREIAGHPYHRSETARLLVRALAHGTDDQLRIGCAALGQLRASSALPFLQSCAESPSRAVADEARVAIDAIRAGRVRPGSAPGGPRGADGPVR